MTEIREWQDIETAPMPVNEPLSSGPRLLLALTYGSIRIGSYSYSRTGKGRWRDDNCQLLRDPTHFMLLPDPPISTNTRGTI